MPQSADDRLRNLERQLSSLKSRLRFLLGLVVVLVGVGFTIAWTPGSAELTSAYGHENAAESRIIEADTVIASKFVVEGEDGVRLARLEGTAGQASLMLFDQSGGVRASLHVIAGMPGLVLYDENRERRAAIDLDVLGPDVTLHDPAGESRAQLFVFSEGPGLVMSDGTGEMRALMSVLEGQSELNLFSQQGRMMWSAPR